MNDASIYADGHSLEAAALWIQGLILGQVGTSIAVLAIAIIGLNMLRGTLSARDGVRSLLGCFILFGAPAIAHGVMGTLPRSTGPEVIVPLQPPVPSLHKEKQSSPSINPFDPYAGQSAP
ncbi:TrbC/VirB2 family protein [Sphingobium sp. AP49]|uniref:TrbC/VirB2 family protein n=1 Tax=Sphingobium sp. AP49 TaxID=1144307 RepID=UPI0009D98256|nr:TrbC/VirB2 family protein [Sphingobium sp. AP49]WHO38398.1 TrbC/VirB2 family protein [Sphingobium sp. AP49]